MRYGRVSILFGRVSWGSLYGASLRDSFRFLPDCCQSLFVLLLISVVYQMCLKRQALWQKVISDISSSNRQVVQILRLSALLLQFDSLEMRVHRHVHAGYRASDHRAILELDCDSLTCELHQESDQLHIFQIIF